MKKVLRTARRAKVYFRKLPRRIHGRAMYDDTDFEIWIDLHKEANPARVFLHELLHRMYPHESETNIRLRETKMWRRMSEYQRFALYRNLFSRKWRTKPFGSD